MPAKRIQTGVTLVELLVTIAVLVILVALAAPSFSDFAERNALRGVADNVVATIGSAREEAIKRDSLVRVEFKAVGAEGFCVGAAAVTTASAAGCDCSSTTCPVASFPSAQRDLRQARLADTPAFGTDTAFVIDPKTGTLENIADAGSIQLDSRNGYGVGVQVNAMGRASLCTPSGKKAIGSYGACP